jgi:Transglycosylase SLT domain
MPVPAAVSAAAKAAKLLTAYRKRGGRLWWLIALALVVPAMPAAGCTTLMLLVATTIGGDDDALAAAVAATVNVDVLPPAATALLPDVQRILASSCPELPVAWLIAQVEVESGWNEHAYSPAGAAGLVQMMRGSWAEAGGALDGWATDARPVDAHAVWDPITHLEVAVKWMCGNLRSIGPHVAETDKPLTVLQAMAVCHIAGCLRVTSSVSGVPQPGEAGCEAACSADVQNYVTQVTSLYAAYSAIGPANADTGPLPGAPMPYTGVAGGCVVDDPTSAGCLTPTAAHLYAQVTTAFGTWPWSVTCWDAHAWNPSSDHPRGRACDYTVGTIGQHPSDADNAVGWQLADWLTAHAGALRVSYVIWQGQIWQPSRGWRPYSGGGVYDPTDATGGHYDHVHVSTSE